MSRILGRKVVIALFIAAMSLLMFLSMVSTAQAQIALTPKEDSTVTSSMPDKNEGNHLILHVRWDAQCERWTYIKFDLSGLPPVPVTNVVLWLFCKLDGPIPSDVIYVDVCEASNEWTEMEITWNNKPAGDPGSMLATTAVDGYPAWYKWESSALTDYVNTHIGGDMSLIVKLSIDGAAVNHRGFFSREYFASPPLLDINPPDPNKRSVGGFDVPVNKFALLAPYAALVLAIAFGTVITTLSLKRIKEK